MSDGQGLGWWHPVQCVDVHDEQHNCLDGSGSIIGWREEHETDPLPAIRAAALDEARAAVQDTRRSLTAGPGQDATDVHIAWALGEALAAIDALREGER